MWYSCKRKNTGLKTVSCFFFAFLPEAAGRRTNSAEGATVPL